MCHAEVTSSQVSPGRGWASAFDKVAFSWVLTARSSNRIRSAGMPSRPILVRSTSLPWSSCPNRSRATRDDDLRLRVAPRQFDEREDPLARIVERDLVMRGALALQHRPASI